MTPNSVMTKARTKTLPLVVVAIMVITTAVVLGLIAWLNPPAHDENDPAHVDNVPPMLDVVALVDGVPITDQENHLTLGSTLMLVITAEDDSGVAPQIAVDDNGVGIDPTSMSCILSRKGRFAIVVTATDEQGLVTRSAKIQIHVRDHPLFIVPGEVTRLETPQVRFVFPNGIDASAILADTVDLHLLDEQGKTLPDGVLRATTVEQGESGSIVLVTFPSAMEFLRRSNPAAAAFVRGSGRLTTYETADNPLGLIAFRTEMLALIEASKDTADDSKW